LERVRTFNVILELSAITKRPGSSLSSIHPMFGFPKIGPIRRQTVGISCLERLHASNRHKTHRCATNNREYTIASKPTDVTMRDPVIINYVQLARREGIRLFNANAPNYVLSLFLSFSLRWRNTDAKLHVAVN